MDENNKGRRCLFTRMRKKSGSQNYASYISFPHSPVIHPPPSLTFNTSICKHKRKMNCSTKMQKHQESKTHIPPTHLSYFSTIIYISLKGFCISRFKEDIRSFTTCPEFIYFKQVFIRCQDINLKIF